MNWLSFTQEYMLIALASSGRFPAMREMECNACLVASGLAQLMLDGVVEMDAKKRFHFVQGRHNTVTYLQPLCDVLAERQPMKTSQLVDKYMFGGRRMNVLFNAVGDSLAAKGLVASHSVVLSSRNRYTCENAAAVDAVVQKLRAELLENGPVSDEMAVLAAMLYKSNMLSRYFSKYESKTIKQRIRELKANQSAKIATDLIDQVFVFVAVIATR